MNRGGVLLLLLCTLLTSALGGQQSRGPVPAPATGTGRIAGVVVDAKAQPVRSAVVRLTGADLPGGRATISNDDGTFTFEAVPAGRFSLTSSKPAYLAAAYGAVKPGGAGTPIALAPGQQLSGVTLAMPRGSAITGVVRDETGAPLQGLMVYIIRPNAPTAAAAPGRDEVYTDDRGVYRIFGLSPGTYYVAADRRSSGGLGGVGVMSASEVDATFARLQRGEGRGASTTPTERSPSSIVRPTRTFDPAPIFYPGVSSFGMAAPVTLGLGEVREGIDFSHQLVSSVTLGGSVSGAETGQSVQLSLSPEGGTPMGRGFGAGPMLQRRTSTGDGEFVFTGVTPGKYTLLAVSASAGATDLAASATKTRFARTLVEVVGNDIGGLSLALQPTLRVSGRVEFPGGPAPTGRGLGLAVILVPPVAAVPGNAAAVGVVPVAGTILRPSASVREDGTFEIVGVLDSGYRLTTARNPAGWQPRSALLAGTDILDHVVQITRDVSGIELTMTSQPPQLSGRLLKPDNTPAPGYFVIAFTTDRGLWQPNARRLRAVRPGTDGSFRFDDLPAGEYYVATLTEADSDEWQAASFLSEVVPAAIKVTIGDGEKKVQDLRIGR